MDLRLRARAICARMSCCLLVGFLTFASLGDVARAIDINIDYTYDSSSFFGSGNPDGAASGTLARNALEAAADYFSGILNDTFEPVTIPEPFVGAESTFTWSFNFTNPSTGSGVVLTEGGVVSDEYRIYAGARNIGTLGIGGPGSWARSLEGSGTLYGNEIAEYNAKKDSFEPVVYTRGDPESEFASWGGQATFDTSANWHYDHTVPPTSNSQNDFFSVALHELGHALGMGASPEWNALVSNGFFTGAASYVANDGASPAVSDGHWTPNTQSTVYGTSTLQEAAMDPNITTGTRKLWTDLDAAGLTDIGWSVAAPPTPGDFTGNGTVNGADLTQWQGDFGLNAYSDANSDGSSNGLDFLIWQQNFGAGEGATPNFTAVPEPTTLSICVLAVVAIVCMALPRKRQS
ncbi:matrixin family metalloprotease [Adhaeretor mobilis]|uniref:Matrixin n=1 Tax=Adhaeretor mobilis TaxID=1930276 RepID=A0A517MUY2_9BACT|nr:matrixin family metalloprotease [Adhaeretor mobilis]QDS98694.1 Matrixin [Adhaeretor mobilis]